MIRFQGYSKSAIAMVVASISCSDFVAMKALACGPIDLADARAVIDLDREPLDLELLWRFAQRFGRDGTRVVRW
ncbi:MAG: hypothetical protein NDI84_13095 [Steroidobacteraceae bacterium]|nr:hypothetical protein [Steroidobacteraceae bacterium]